MSGSACPVCSSKKIKVFIRIENVPVHCNLLWDNRDAAQLAERGDVHLGFCSNCGHIFNCAFQTELLKYNQDYENSLFFSPRFREYSQALAEDLIDRYDLHGKQIIEVGSGNGEFLRLLCNLGGNSGMGFDPSQSPEHHPETLEQITYIQDYYSKKYSHLAADFICCRHVLEHLNEPKEILSTIIQSIKNRSDAFVFFEVPNVMFTLADMGIWDIIYEHYSYFSPNSLGFLFTASGFEISNLYSVYNNQFLCIEGRLGVNTNYASGTLQSLEDSVDGFSKKFFDEKAKWRQIISNIAAQGKKAVIWGAGSKGVTFLNLLDPEGVINFVVDINPLKKGKYIAGTGQAIVSPEFLLDYKPEIIIIMNSIYVQEIMDYVKKLGIYPEYMQAS